MDEILLEARRRDVTLFAQNFKHGFLRSGFSDADNQKFLRSVFVVTKKSEPL